MGIVTAARPLAERLKELGRALEDALEEENVETLSPLMELRSVIAKIERMMGNVLGMLDDGDGQCRWIEYRRRGQGRRPIVAWNAAPLQIADQVRERVLNRMKTVVLTSATLTSALGHLGETDDARAALEQVYQSRPDFSGPLLCRLFRFRHEPERACFLDGLRKAGLPD